MADLIADGARQAPQHRGLAGNTPSAAPYGAGCEQVPQALQADVIRSEVGQFTTCRTFGFRSSVRLIVDIGDHTRALEPEYGLTFVHPMDDFQGVLLGIHEKGVRIRMPHNRPALG